jgi:hypothetical protein
MEITEGFDFNRFEDERPAGEEYELETFDYISGDLADNERLATSYDTTYLTGDALGEIEERHLKDAVDTWGRTIKKAYRYTGVVRLNEEDFRLNTNGRLYLKEGNVELTDGVRGRYKPISELKPSNGVGFPYSRIKEMFPDLETQGRPLGREELAVLRKAVEDAPGESTEQAVSTIQKSIDSLPTNAVSVSAARYKNFLRQLQSYETVLARYAAQRADHLSQAAELEREITKSEKWYDTTDFGEDVEGRDTLAKEIRQMREQRDVHLSEAAKFDVETRSQITQISDAVASFTNSNEPFAVRVENFFKALWAVIVSTATAISFMISTIVLAVTGNAPKKKDAPPTAENKAGAEKKAGAENKAGAEDKAAATAATTANPIPTTLYDEPELATTGFGGSVNWLHTKLESLSNWLKGIIDGLEKSKRPLAPPFAWLLKYVNRLVSWLSEHTYSRPIKAE